MEFVAADVGAGARAHRRRRRRGVVGRVADVRLAVESTRRAGDRPADRRLARRGAGTRPRRAGMVAANAGLGLPPVVLGVFLALILLPSSLLGPLEWTSTLQGVILAQTLLALPIVVALTAAAVAQLPAGLLDQARAYGASGARRALLALREARVGVMAAAIAALGSALAEVGAVVIVGGNLRGQTDTLASAVLLDLSAGDPVGATAHVLVLVGLVLLLGAVLTVVQQRVSAMITRRALLAAGAAAGLQLAGCGGSDFADRHRAPGARPAQRGHRLRVALRADRGRAAARRGPCHGRRREVTFSDDAAGSTRRWRTCGAGRGSAAASRRSPSPPSTRPPSIRSPPRRSGAAWGSSPTSPRSPTGRRPSGSTTRAPAVCSPGRRARGPATCCSCGPRRRRRRIRSRAGSRPAEAAIRAVLGTAWSRPSPRRGGRTGRRRSGRRCAMHPRLRTVLDLERPHRAGRGGALGRDGVRRRPRRALPSPVATGCARCAAEPRCAASSPHGSPTSPPRWSTCRWRWRASGQPRAARCRCTCSPAPRAGADARVRARLHALS